MKVTFDGVNRLIIVNDGVTELDAQIDLYSDWKEWISWGDNAKFLPAMRTVGGDPTTGVKFIAPYFFLTNGWKIRPYEGNHTLIINGNLFVDEPGIYGHNLTVPTLGPYTVTIVLSTTSDAIIAAAAITEQDKLDIADRVLDENIFEHQKTGSVGKEISDTKKQTRINTGLIVAK